jgi:hypothetical protein
VNNLEKTSKDAASFANVLRKWPNVGYYKDEEKIRLCSWCKNGHDSSRSEGRKIARKIS